MPKEHGDVSLALPQRRQVNSAAPKAEVEIPPETARRRLFPQVGVGGRDDPGVHPPGLGGPQWMKLAVFDGPQQLGLKVQRQLPDFVQEQRPAVGPFEQAGLVRLRAGECSLLISD